MASSPPTHRKGPHHNRYFSCSTLIRRPASFRTTLYSFPTILSCSTRILRRRIMDADGPLLNLNWFWLNAFLFLSSAIESQALIAFRAPPFGPPFSGRCQSVYASSEPQSPDRSSHLMCFGSTRFLPMASSIFDSLQL